MTNHIPQLRIFISSPGDLSEQRDIAEDVLTELFNRRTYRDTVTAQIIRWDKPQRGNPYPRPQRIPPDRTSLVGRSVSAAVG